jgi:predicted nucleic acid-binding protein
VSFLLDTDICSAYLRGNQVITNRIVQYGGRIHVSVISVAELTAWARRSKAPPSRLQGLAQLLGFVQVLGVDEQIAERWGRVRATQLDAGTLTPRVDLLIGVTALVHNLTLVTHNVKDYVYVPGLYVIDWLGP